MPSPEHHYTHHQKNKVRRDRSRARVVARDAHACEETKNIDGAEYDACPGERLPLPGNYQDEPDSCADACCEFQECHH